MRIDTEAKFDAFLNWARASETASVSSLPNASDYLAINGSSCFVIQLVRQVNYGPLESKRLFAKTAYPDMGFGEVTEQDLIQANYQKVNSYKNFKRVTHDKFFELNLYQKDPVNKHHWRVNIARPASDIDLPWKVPDVSLKDSTTIAPQLETSHITHPTQKIETDLKSASIADPTPTMSTTTIAPTQRLETGTGTSHGNSGTEEGIEHLTKDIHGFGIGGVQDVSDHYDIDEYPADGYEYTEYGRSRSRSPEDYTACSADDCGYCGHCSY